LSTLVRPFRVKLFVVLDLVLGMLVLLPGLIVYTRPFPAFGVFNGLAAIVFALVDFILAYAVWTSRKWAWATSLIFSLLGIVASLFVLFIRQRTGEFVLLIIDLVIVYSLMQPGVQRYFGKGSTLLASRGIEVREPGLARFLAVYREFGEAYG
jgi:hypothetical protein